MKRHTLAYWFNKIYIFKFSEKNSHILKFNKNGTINIHLSDKIVNHTAMLSCMCNSLLGTASLL